MKTTSSQVDPSLLKPHSRQISLAGTRPNNNPDLQENFPEGHKGLARDAIASRQVEVNSQAESFTIYIGQRGQVEQVRPIEQQISVNFEGGSSKIRFYPHSLTMIALAPPPYPYKVGDIVFVDIDRFEAAEPQEKKWSGFWGKVTQIGEMTLESSIFQHFCQLYDLRTVQIVPT